MKRCWFFTLLFLFASFNTSLAQNRPGNGNPGPSTNSENELIDSYLAGLLVNLKADWKVCMKSNAIPSDLYRAYQSLKTITDLKGPNMVVNTPTADCTDCVLRVGVQEIDCFLNNQQINLTLKSLRKTPNYRNYFFGDNDKKVPLTDFLKLFDDHRSIVKE